MCLKKDKVELPTPEFMFRRKQWKKRRATIEVDSCCADVLLELWKHRIDTLYHCCGHGWSASPYIILAPNCPEKISDVKKLIAQKDSRNWEVR